MCLIKQKLKTKHYQYLYLLHKLYEKMERINWYEDMCGEYNEEESNRVSFYIKWLHKINKKYNYA